MSARRDATAVDAATARHAPLDAWRGAAILAVFVYHCFLELNIAGVRADDVAPGDPGWVGVVASGTFSHFFPHHLGTFGVQLFFVISGYCIHRSTRAWDARHPGSTSGERWRAYAGRRFWRIYPLYALVLLALFALGTSPPRPDGPGAVSRLGDLAVHAAMLQTLVPDHINLINPSLWSLAVEVHWYVLYPLVWLAFRRWGAARVMLVAAALCLGWALVVPAFTRSPWVVNLPWRWGFEWTLGAFVAETVGHRRWPRGRVVALAAVVGVAILLPTRSAFAYATVPPLVFALVVAHAARRSGLARAVRPLAGVGRVSYSLYLIHQPALGAAATWLVARGVRTVDLGPFLAVSVAMFLVTTATAWGLERIGRRLQRLA